MQVDALIEQLQTFAANAEKTEKIDLIIENDVSLSVVILQGAAQQVADELIALQSIFGDDSVVVLPIQSSSNVDFNWLPRESIRLCITIPLDSDLKDDTSLSFKLSATLPSGYPHTTTPPQLQLLSKYIGSHGVDHILFGQVLRAFHQGSDAVLFQQGEVALFDGIERVREKVEEWFSEREANRLQRKQEDHLHKEEEQVDSRPVEIDGDHKILSGAVQTDTSRQAKGFTLYTAPTITERKSVFLGHAAVLTDVSQVSIILAEIVKDRKVARATHPAIYAWVCRPKAGEVVHRDCNDDGETAAGGRLAHLLDLLHLENVIVVVTRWYGGVQLGPDRFKLINRAARDALEVAQLVTGPLNAK